MDLKEQQNIIDSVNHIGRIVKRYASCNISLRAPNYLQLGNCLQFSTLFGHIWDNWGNYQGNLRHFGGNFWHCKENYRQYLDNFEPNCVTIGAIVTLLGQSWIFQGNLGHCLGNLWLFWKASILLYIQAYMLLYIKASMILYIGAEMFSYIKDSMILYKEAEMISYIQASMTLYIQA